MGTRTPVLRLPTHTISRELSDSPQGQPPPQPFCHNGVPGLLSGKVVG